MPTNGRKQPGSDVISEEYSIDGLITNLDRKASAPMRYTEWHAC